MDDESSERAILSTSCTIKYVIIIVVLYSLAISSPCVLFFPISSSSFSKKKEKKKNFLCVNLHSNSRCSYLRELSRETNAHAQKPHCFERGKRFDSFSFFSLSVSVSVSLSLSKAKLEFEKARVRFFFHALFFPCPDLFKFRGCSSSSSSFSLRYFYRGDSRDGKNNVRSRAQSRCFCRCAALRFLRALRTERRGRAR